MITQLLAILNVLILSILSILHFYWAFGGKWQHTSAIPTDANGVAIFAPGKGPTLFVGFGLLIMSACYLTMSGLLLFGSLSTWIAEVSGWVMVSVFLIRAIGDFKYVGFFKSVKNTDFARYDRQLYSPLCLYLSISTLLILLMP